MRFYTLCFSLLAAAAVSGCRDADGKVVKMGDDDRAQPPGVSRVGTVAAMNSPESVRYDPDQDVFFVSNIYGFGSEKDGHAYISRINAAKLSDVTVFITSGRNGVTLDAPKGMAIQGDTLWVTDIDVVRGFNRKTGAPVGVIDLKPYNITMLNDMALAPDGTLRVTDTGILMTEKGTLRPGGDKIIQIGPGHAVTVLKQGEDLGEPNGITWDPVAKRWVVVGFKRFNAKVFGYTPDFSQRSDISQSVGEFDGVEVLPSGAIIYTSWIDSTIHVVQGGKDSKLIRFVPEPADIGYDSKRGIVAVPLVMMDQVEFFSVPGELTAKRP